MIDLTGKKYGKLTVLEFVGKKKRHYMWRCKCDCGKERIVSSDNLNSGNTKSCGCLRKDKIINLSGKRFGYLTVIKKHHSGKYVYWLCKCDCGRETVVNGSSLRNGHTRSCGCGSGRTQAEREKTYHFYHVWWNILQRCKNKNAISYPNYGGRGIKICKRWEDYLLFKEDMFEGYSVGLQIDRIDNNGDYCKENCKWVTSKENARNRRSNVWVTINGVRKLASEWNKNNVAKFLKKHQFDGITLIEGGKYDNTEWFASLVNLGQTINPTEDKVPDSYKFKVV